MVCLHLIREIYIVELLLEELMTGVMNSSNAKRKGKKRFLLISYTVARWTPPLVPENMILKIMYIATKCVQFGFNNTIFQKVDGISMGSPLCIVLSNIFVGFPEEILFKTTNKPVFYKWYSDNTFVVFSLRSESRCFFHRVNQPHPVLTFICELENGNSLPFPDVLVEWTYPGIQTSIYQKPILTGSYT